MKNIMQREALARLNHRVDVVGHDAPCEQPIALAVEVQQRVFRQPGDVWLAQPTFSEAKKASQASIFVWQNAESAGHRERQHLAGEFFERRSSAGMPAFPENRAVVTCAASARRNYHAWPMWVKACDAAGIQIDTVQPSDILRSSMKTPATIRFFCVGQFLVWAFNLAADPLDVWHWRNPSPCGGDFRGITYAENKYVAVGDAGVLFTSADGLSWTEQDSGTAQNLLSIGYGNGLLVATGTNGVLITSSDGAAWRVRDAGTTNALHGVVYGNGLFVVVGRNGTIQTSSDGVQWSNQVSGTTRHLYAVTFGAGLFVAVGSFAAIQTSTNGVDWVSRSAGTSLDFKGITYNNGLFVAVSAAGHVFLSTDAVNWAVKGADGKLYGVTHGTDTFVAVSDGVVFYSTDGTNWSASLVGPYNSLSAVAYGGGQYVAVGTNGLIMTSTYGTNWSQSSFGDLPWLMNVAEGGGQFIAVARSGAILASTNARNWVLRNSGLAGDLRSIAYGNGTFVIVGGSGLILSSGDGMNWTNHSQAASASFLHVAYGNGLFVASASGPNVSAKGIYTSSDSAVWTLQTTNGGGAVVYGSGIFVQKGTATATSTSPDATNWTLHTISGQSGDVRGIAYGGGVFAAAGFPGTYIRTSIDGVNWTNRATGFSSALNDLRYANGSFVAVGEYGALFTSPNGTVWTRRSSKSAKNFWGLTYGQSTFLAVGENGSILQSADFSIPILSGSSLSTDGNFQFSVTGEIGRQYRLQTITNLTDANWADLFTFTNTTTTMQLLDTQATNYARRFYRAVSP